MTTFKGGIYNTVRINGSSHVVKHVFTLRYTAKADSIKLTPFVDMSNPSLILVPVDSEFVRNE